MGMGGQFLPGTEPTKRKHETESFQGPESTNTEPEPTST